MVYNIFNKNFKIWYRSTLFEGYTSNFSSFPAQRRSDIDIINYGYLALDYEPANHLGIGSISLIVSHLIFPGTYHIPYDPYADTFRRTNVGNLRFPLKSLAAWPYLLRFEVHVS